MATTVVTISAAVLPSGDPGWLALARTCCGLKEKGADRRVPAAEDDDVVGDERVGDTETADGERSEV